MYLMHLGIQFALVLLLFVFAGYQLDRFFHISWFGFTFLFGLLGLGAALYILMKEINRHERNKPK